MNIFAMKINFYVNLNRSSGSKVGVSSK